MESLSFRKQTLGCSVCDLVTWAGVESGPTGMQWPLWNPDFSACGSTPRSAIAGSRRSSISKCFLRTLCTVFLQWLHQFPFSSTVRECESHSVTPDSLQPCGLYSPWNPPGQNTGVGSRSLLQGILSTQGLNPVSCIVGRFFYGLSHKGSSYSV